MNPNEEYEIEGKRRLEFALELRALCYVRVWKRELRSYHKRQIISRNGGSSVQSPAIPSQLQAEMRLQLTPAVPANDPQLRAHPWRH